MRSSNNVSTSFLVLGALLSALGVGAFVLSGAASPTALIPAFVGLPIVLVAWIARRSAAPLRWHVVAALLALLGLSGSLRGLVQLPALLGGAELERPTAVVVQAIMAILCLVFLVPLIARLSTLRFADGRFDER